MVIENRDDIVVSEAIRKARNMRRLLWVGILWIAAWLSICLEAVIINTDSVIALEMASVVGAFVSILALPILVLVGLIGRFVAQWKPLRPYRWWVSLLLPLGLCFQPVVLGIGEKIDPPKGFERYLNAKAPEDARHFTANVSNLPLGDLSATYSFECSKQQTERLIHDLSLHQPESPSDIAKHALPGVLPVWKAAKYFDNFSKERYTGFIQMWTDDTLTRVLIWKWDT